MDTFDGQADGQCVHVSHYASSGQVNLTAICSQLGCTDVYYFAIVGKVPRPLERGVFRVSQRMFLNPK